MTPNVRMIQVIETTLTYRGKGTADDPGRRVKEYWTLEGEKLAEYDINDTLGCNERGHRVRHGTTGCSHCSATLLSMARAAGVLP